MAAGSGASSAGAVLVLDLDHFKTVNDRFGHVAGDDVLIDLSRRLRASLRKADLLARYGGEEFVVLLPGANLAVARQIAERMGHAVQSAPCLPHVAGGGIRVTASIGVALIPSVQPGQTPEQFARQTIETADTALRAAKHGGRNRIVAEARAVFA
jgi:two-component system cell cycle response regulator